MERDTLMKPSPGVFIDGDDCAYLYPALRELLRTLPEPEDVHDKINRGALEALLEALAKGIEGS